MKEEIKHLARENNPAIQGIIISAIILIAGIFPKHFSLKIWEVLLEFTMPIDSWLLITIGFSSLFYFFSMRVNQNTQIRDGAEWFITPVHKSNLSKECFKIAVISLIMFIIRGGYLLLKEII